MLYRCLMIFLCFFLIFPLLAYTENSFDEADFKLEFYSDRIDDVFISPITFVQSKEKDSYYETYWDPVNDLMLKYKYFEHGELLQDAHLTYYYDDESCDCDYWIKETIHWVEEDKHTIRNYYYIHHKLFKKEIYNADGYLESYTNYQYRENGQLRSVQYFCVDGPYKVDYYVYHPNNTLDYIHSYIQEADYDETMTFYVNNRISHKEFYDQGVLGHILYYDEQGREQKTVFLDASEDIQEVLLIEYGNDVQARESADIYDFSASFTHPVITKVLTDAQNNTLAFWRASGNLEILVIYGNSQHIEEVQIEHPRATKVILKYSDDILRQKEYYLGNHLIFIEYFDNNGDLQENRAFEDLPGH